MDERDWLVERFEAHRSHLRAVAYRMLGSLSEADDAVQEAWVRVSAAETSDVENLGGWLTTVVARVCLNMLRSRTTRREEPLDAHVPDPIVSRGDAIDPEHDALLADSVGLALLVVLETLTPAERLAFVLHDTFGVPFDEIGPMIGRTPGAARQLASRARRRVRNATTTPDADLARQREVVDAFFAAARDGDFDALVALLDPDVVARSDGGPGAACSAVPRPWPGGHSWAPARTRWSGHPSSTGHLASSSPPTGNRCRSWPSLSATGRSSRSTPSPTPNASPCSTCPCSTTNTGQGLAAGCPGAE
jgi:RNA polymerase sigma-70 factor (ECF subfamily)